MCVVLWCHHVLQCQQPPYSLLLSNYRCLLVLHVCFTGHRVISLSPHPLSPSKSPPPPSSFLLTEMTINPVSGHRGSNTGRTPSLWSRARPGCLFLGPGYGSSEDWLFVEQLLEPEALLAEFIFIVAVDTWGGILTRGCYLIILLRNKQRNAPLCSKTTKLRNSVPPIASLW